MEVRTYKVYKFEELSESAQEKAIERIVQGNHEFFDSDILTEVFTEKLAEYGFPTDNIEWSLSYSQGDGVAFYGNVDVRQYLTKTKQLRKFRTLTGKDPYVFIRRNSWGTHYSHYNTMDIVDDTYNLTVQNTERMEELCEIMLEDVKKVSGELESLGYAELDRISSKEYIMEQIEANDWLFTEGGVID